MKTKEDLEKRLEWANEQFMDAQINLARKSRIGNHKSIQTARMDIVSFMMEINVLEWVLNQRTDEESGYNKAATGDSPND